MRKTNHKRAIEDNFVFVERHLKKNEIKKAADILLTTLGMINELWFNDKHKDGYYAKFDELDNKINSLGGSRL